MYVASSHDVSVAVHRLGGNGRPLVFAHATGFHGCCYRPIADRLTESFTSYALDFRGHGRTPTAPTPLVDWEEYGDDMTAVGRELGAFEPIVGFGHSMGATALLMAARRDPEKYALIIAYEPIVFPPLVASGSPESPLVLGAQRRRRSFASHDAAVAHYANKAPFSRFSVDVLEAYVQGGFRADGAQGVTLCCDPEHEALTYARGASNRVWEYLSDITTPVVVVSGRVDEMTPASLTAEIARRLPRSERIQLDHLDHFGPMTHPDDLAELVIDAVGRFDPSPAG